VNVQVAYVGPEGTVLVDVEVGEGASIADALAASEIVTRLGLFEAALSYAVHGQRAERSTPLRAGDRVELLRPLIADPKEARRKRAADHPLPRPARRPRSRR
jgi:putative ubiquitin-RnfH superfamily antitoxin RatB of RatAB toxin-antitoxin module